MKNIKIQGTIFYYKGYKIFYRVVGEGENLILVHGYPYNSYDYISLIELFQNKRLILFDFLGMGFSDKPKNLNYTFELYQDILNKLILF